MKSHLKVKVVSLAAEMTYIRRQEEKWKTRAKIAREKVKDDEYHRLNFWTLRSHREELKVEARSSHLAYGCMRGIPYAAMENLCYGPLKGMGGSEPDWGAVEGMVERFSRGEGNQQAIMQKFAEWLADAKAWYEANPERIKKFEQARLVLQQARRMEAASKKLTAK